MDENQEPERLYSLVDVTSLEATSFLKLAPLKQILLWGKIFGMDGKVTKRLDLISDLEQLQYLYWNSTQQPPADDLDTLVSQCAELSTKVVPDETSVDELTSRIPEEILGANQLNEEAGMAELKKPKDKKKGSSKKKAAAGTEAAAPGGTEEVKEKTPKTPVDHSTSNKAKVFAAFVSGVTDVEALQKAVGGAVKDTTIKSWIAGWYRGDNLPAVATDTQKATIIAKGVEVAKQKEKAREEAQKQKDKEKADKAAKKKAEEDAAAAAPPESGADKKE